MIGLEIKYLFDDYLVGDKRSSLRCSQFSHSSFLQNKQTHIFYLPTIPKFKQTISTFTINFTIVLRKQTNLSKRFLCISQHCSFPGEQPSALYGQGHVCQFKLKETFIEKHQQLNHPRWKMKTLKLSTFPLNVTQGVFAVSYSQYITCIACSFPIGAPKAVLLWA